MTATKKMRKSSDSIHRRIWLIVTNRKYVPEAQADPEDGTKKQSKIGHSCLQLSSFEEIPRRVLCRVGLNVSIATIATVRGCSQRGRNTAEHTLWPSLIALEACQDRLGKRKQCKSFLKQNSPELAREESFSSECCMA